MKFDENTIQFKKRERQLAGTSDKQVSCGRPLQESALNDRRWDTADAEMTMPSSVKAELKLWQVASLPRLDDTVQIYNYSIASCLLNRGFRQNSAKLSAFLVHFSQIFLLVCLSVCLSVSFQTEWFASFITFSSPGMICVCAVSYTHLTLPTSGRV